MSSLPPPLPPPQPIPKKGLSGCAITAIVVGVLIGLIVIGLGVGGYWFMKQAGGRGVVAKAAIGMANPDYDILNIDDKEKTITVRHKKTGKTATFPISHMRDGHVDPAELDMTHEEAEGTGSAPSWVRYPKASQISSAQIIGITTLMYQTDDPVDTVMEYYRASIGEQGIQASFERGGAIAINDSKGILKISVASSSDKHTVITVVFRGK